MAKNSGGVDIIGSNLSDYAVPLNKSINDLTGLVRDYRDVALPAGSADYTLLLTDVAPEGRSPVVRITGTLTANRNVLWPVSGGSRVAIFWNNTTGAFTVNVKTDQGSSTGVKVPQGYAMALFHNGTHVYAAGLAFAPSTSSTGGTFVEGTWTPALSIGGSTVGITYTTQQGTYERVGNQVTARCRITLSSKGGLAGAVLLTGLPFAAQNPEATSSAPYVNQATYTGDLTGLAGSNSTSMSLWIINGGTSAQLNGTNLNNTFDLIMTVTYRTV